MCKFLPRQGNQFRLAGIERWHGRMSAFTLDSGIALCGGYQSRNTKPRSGADQADGFFSFGLARSDLHQIIGPEFWKGERQSCEIVEHAQMCQCEFFACFADGKFPAIV